MQTTLPCTALIVLIPMVLGSCAHGKHEAQEPLMTSHSRDRAAIAEVIDNIARNADLRQWDAVRACFAGEVELDYGTPERLTPDEIIEHWQPLLSAFEATQHVLSDVRIEIAGDRGRAWSRFQATHLMRDVPGGEIWTLSGQYEHDLARTPAGWKVTRMRMIPGESSGNPQLLEHARARAQAALPATSPATTSDVSQ